MKLKYTFKRTITNSSAGIKSSMGKVSKPEVPDGMLKKCNASVSGHSGIWNFFRWRSILHLMSGSCGFRVWDQNQRAGSCAQGDTEVWTLTI